MTKAMINQLDELNQVLNDAELAEINGGMADVTICTSSCFKKPSAA